MWHLRWRPACRLTRQVSAFYDEVLRCLNVFPLNQHFDRSWTAHVAVKSALYEAESQMQAAAALHVDDDVHIEITRLKVAETTPNSTIAISVSHYVDYRPLVQESWNRHQRRLW